MNDQFDKKLVSKINELFDDFEGDSANESWTELRKRFPEKESKPKAVWWFSSAAAVLLLCGIWFFSNQRIENLSETAKTSHQSPIKKLNDTGSVLNISISPEKPIENIPDSQENAFRSKAVSYNAKNHRGQLTIERKRSLPARKLRTIANVVPPAQEDSEYELTLMALTSDQTKPTEGAEDIAFSSDSSQQKVSTVIASTEKNMNANEIYPSEVISGDELSDLVQANKTKKRSKAIKKLTIGIFAGTYFNYAEGSETNINTGVGLTSDIKISKRIKISTGVSLGQNTLKYNQLIPRDAALDFATVQNSTAFSTKQSFGPSSTLSYSINSYDAKLVGFDVPVNLKYTILEKKNTVYLSTGFSSNFFINESYTYEFDYQTNSNSSTTSPTQQSTSNFQSFDFARVLNFSLGLDHRLNNQTKLIFEPFIKYPLSGLGAYDLRFGAAGINLKLNFNRLK